MASDVAVSVAGGPAVGRREVGVRQTSGRRTGPPVADLPPLRLTARGRRVVVALALLLAVGLIALGGAVLGGNGDELELMGTASVIVEPGDTLWSIARAAAGERDVRDVVDVIQALNGLDGADIEPGQVLAVP